jgi:N-acylneuraminate cytidylyltransferase
MTMSEKPTVLALIPARGGSKGLPRKNVLPLGGKPMIGWTIEAALGANCVSRVVLSSDDDEIIETAANFGCDVPFVRPDSLSSDYSSTMDVIMHALDQLPGFDYVILLQPTSPLRHAQDIDNAFSLMCAQGAPACVSICSVDESPYWMFQLEGQGRLRQVLQLPSGITRRQDLPSVFYLNGAVYIADVKWLRREKNFISSDTVGYVMPRSRSLDIDTSEDFMKASELI